MRFNQEKCVSALVGLLVVLVAVGLVALGYQLAKHRYNKPYDTKVERDTVCVTDTIPHYYPKPVEVIKTKTDYRWLTRVENTTDTLHDSVLVAVPITSKHYHGSDYDAYVSGCEPSLDSIFVYNETQLITERVVVSKPPNKWSLSVNAGVDYGTTSQFWQPYASGELTINNDKRLQLGIEGGMRKNEVTNNFEPFAGAKLKLKIF